MEKYTGACHCGAVTFEADADLSQVIQCNCSHCAIKSLLLTFVPENQFSLLSGEENLTEYRFNKKVIAHLFCKTCGVQPFGKGQDEKGNKTIAINVRTLAGVKIAGLSPIPYNGKDV